MMVDGGDTNQSQRRNPKIRTLRPAKIPIDHIGRLAWALYHAEGETDAPVDIEVTDDFLEWIRQQDVHPILGTLQPSLAYDAAIEWPSETNSA
jgi:hypothetical protein